MLYAAVCYINAPHRAARNVKLTCRDDLYAFARIIETPPTGYAAVSNFVQRLVVRAEGVPRQPWIHLVPLILKHHLPCPFPEYSMLEIVMKQSGLGGRVEDYVPMHLTHDSLPKPLAAFHSRFNNVNLEGINFRRPIDFLRFIRSFRNLETLRCVRIRCLEYPGQIELYRSSREPPLKRITFPVWPLEGDYNVPLLPLPAWISVLWSSVRRRYDCSNEYMLEDQETLLVMRMTALSYGCYRRKYLPRLELNVHERPVNGRNSSYMHGS